jgi:hypothetical protein
METMSTARGSGVANALPLEASTSAVSWSAIFVGAVIACAASLILLAVGSALGFASASPWPGSGASVTTFTVMTAIWLIVVQWVASGIGGYLTGRLRTKWVRTHTHEVFFRDTAHGFATWALATLIGTAVLASAVGSVMSAGASAASTIVGGAAESAADAASSSVSAYDVDTLFRSARIEESSEAADPRAQTTRILAKSVTSGELPAADRAYLAELIAARTGIPNEEAQKRVDEAVAQIRMAEVKAREAADAARKAAAQASLYTALSLLIGAFIASAAAALGGRQRDEVPDL